MHESKSNSRRQKQARIIRRTRKLHRTTGILLFAFFFVISLTGLLLGWKKHSGGIILPESFEGTSTDLAKWLPMNELYLKACNYLHDSVSRDLSLELERIDIRKDKGMVKFVFVDEFMGLQLDGVTGQLLQIEKRRSDFIEKIHDGSVIDHYMGTNGEIKLVYTTVMGLALLIFTITGFWLWYGPKRMRHRGRAG